VIFHHYLLIKEKKMFKRTMFISLALTLVMAMVLVSMPMRGTFAAGETPTPAPTATPLVTDLGSGGTHISFWNGLTGSDGTTLNEMLTQFVKENPDVSVTTEIIPWGTLYTKLQAAFVAGQPPDLFLLHASEIPQFYSYGAIMDLSSWYDTNGGPLPSKDFAQPGFDGVMVDGKLSFRSLPSTRMVRTRQTRPSIRRTSSSGVLLSSGPM